MFHPDLAPGVILTTIFYAVLGMLLMVIFLVTFDSIFKLKLKKELIEDHNVAFGVFLAGVAVSIAMIISAVIN